MISKQAYMRMMTIGLNKRASLNKVAAPRTGYDAGMQQGYSDMADGANQLWDGAKRFGRNAVGAAGRWLSDKVSAAGRRLDPTGASEISPVTYGSDKAVDAAGHYMNADSYPGMGGDNADAMTQNQALTSRKQLQEEAARGRRAANRGFVAELNRQLSLPATIDRARKGINNAQQAVENSVGDVTKMGPGVNAGDLARQAGRTQVPGGNDLDARQAQLNKDLQQARGIRSSFRREDAVNAAKKRQAQLNQDRQNYNQRVRADRAARFQQQAAKIKAEQNQRLGGVGRFLRGKWW